MMLEWTNVRRQDVDMIVRATFPEYRGRKIRVAAAEGVTLHDLNWSGGHARSIGERLFPGGLWVMRTGIISWRRGILGRLRVSGCR